MIRNVHLVCGVSGHQKREGDEGLSCQTAARLEKKEMGGARARLRASVSQLDRDYDSDRKIYIQGGSVREARGVGAWTRGP
jgi:hypothetical protein